MTDKEPKRWICKDCGFVSDKTRTKKVDSPLLKATFYCCYECKGHIKESDEWLTWHERMRERTKPGILAMMADIESRRARRLNEPI